MTGYADDTIVYVNPDTRSVIGPVEWLPDGKPKRVPVVRAQMPEQTEQTDKGAKGRPRRRPKEMYYPWCSYRTAKKVYRVAGKDREPERTQGFEEALQKALQEPYWD